MSHATLEQPPAAARAPVHDAGHDRHVLVAVLIASTCILVGLIWDISWHMSIGRDTLWSPPHVLEQIGASLAGLACGAYVLWVTFRGSAAERARSVGFWGFRGPLGAWVCIWGALMMILSIPFDDWWHNAYGLDVQILSPPHSVLAAGMVAIQVGAMLFALAAQNRAADDAAARYRWLYIYAAGILVAMGAIMFFEEIGWPNEWHRAGFYRASAAVFPLFLVSAARASRLRWPATTAAAVYMGIMLLMLWILPLFPARAMLAPIYNPITHMVPMPFPIVLVAPAFAIDLLMHRFREERDWLLAGAIGVAFVAVMLLVHWPFGDFMLSDGARNHFFGAGRWPYTVRVGPSLERFWRLDLAADGNWSGALFAQRLVLAVVAGAVSARIGLWWGSWMRRVLR